MDNPSRRPFPPPSSFIPPTAAVINALQNRRPIWSPYYGYGQLIGQVGYPPAFAHVAHYPDLPVDMTPRPQHTSAFFILN